MKLSLPILLFNFLIFSIIYKSEAQDNTNLTHYFMNPYVINPSFAGTDGKASLFLTYRKQWVGIEGAPVISNFSFHTPAGNKLGFGVNVNNAERGLLNTTSGYITFSYGVPFSKDVTLRFGISGGAAYNGVDVAEIENIGDPELQSLLLDNNMYLIGNAGLSFQVKTLNFGVSVPNLFADKYTSGDGFGVGEVEPLENTILFLSNRFYFGDDKHVFEPFLLYRYSDILPHQIEASAAVHLNHVVWFGGSYKQDFGITAFAGIKLQKVFGVGYAYSLKNTGLNEINSPTHEIQLNLLLGTRKKEKSYYSFVDTSKPKGKTRRQLAIEKRRKEAAKKREEEARKKEEEAKIQAEIERQEKEEEERKAEAARKKEEDRIVAEKRENERLEQEQKRIEGERIAEQKRQAELKELARREKEEKQQAEERKQQVENELEEQVVKESEPIKGDGRNLIGEQYTDERVIVKRGDHLLELEPGEYVVVGAFSSYENAEKHSDELFFKGYQTRFGYITGKKLWYVYLFKGEDIQEARKERDKFRKNGLFTKAWVITVQ
ncbi:PorP/SprF family type IX secretion system membrane protein [Fulvivirga sp. 29W222]|uniref:PorP/SprF family type IX secretion system membrane protein n=1 Tax=Fulvivirga marina TaxID=2494733 RepID=A0A937FTZ0_9BACT|nr:PorP/SprF family type IX secretion system membrane protein [Fulvivirga marina]MBL6444787.1 PorP/SprF family type IX secretion system membrane protein [Fulvivirga marina]